MACGNCTGHKTRKARAQVLATVGATNATEIDVQSSHEEWSQHVSKLFGG
jgi:hypothetical protein